MVEFEHCEQVEHFQMEGCFGRLGNLEVESICDLFNPETKK